MLDGPSSSRTCATLRGHGDWAFGAFLIVRLQPAGLHLMAALAPPGLSGDAPEDLRVNHYAHGR